MTKQRILRLGVLVAFTLCSWPLMAAVPWPSTDGDWVALSYPSSPFVGYDAPDQNPKTVDLVGGVLSSVTYPLAYYSSEGGYLMYRLRVNGDTANPQSVWQVFFDTDDDSPNDLFDYVLQLDLSSDNQVEFVAVDQTTTAVLSAITIDTSNVLWTGLLGTYARYFLPADSSFSGDADYFIDLAMPVGELSGLLGAANQLQVGITTSASHSVINKDFSLNLGGTDTVSSLLSDPFTVPEPRATMILAGLGLMGFAAWRFRRR